MNKSDCKKGKHPLKVIYSHYNAYDEEIVVRWCKKCGAVVVDVDCDNRTSPGEIRKMEFVQKEK